jgi:hypothetical protein
MAHHDDLLKQGPRSASEPHRAAESSWTRKLLTGVVLVLAGIFFLLKLIIGKLIFFALVWAGIVWAAHIGGWVGIVLIAAIVLVVLGWVKAHIS